MLPSPQPRGLGLRSSSVSRPPVGSLALRPGDSLTIPRMALSISFARFVSSTDSIQATGLLTVALVGLTPTEHASLCWTHSFANITSGRRSLTFLTGPPIFITMFALLCSFLSKLLLPGSVREIALENLALRQQLAVMKRQCPRPRLRRVDRVFWVWLSRVWRNWQRAV